MKAFRVVLGILAIIPIFLLVTAASQPAQYGDVTLVEVAYLFLGAPITILNLWAWIEPEIIKTYFPGMERQNKQ